MGDDKVNILLVDDQPSKLLSYHAMLAELGENLIAANSGREALEHLIKTDIAILLMDVSMPDLDGFELAEIIRQHPRYEKTAIIFVSAVHLTDGDRLKGYESGAVDYVSVPIIPQLLRAKVRVFAELYRKTRESERLTRDLEERVRERTAKLEAAVARQTELSEQLRQADRRKDEFLALLAHELRNPLAPIRNAVSMMSLRRSTDPELIWCRDVIDRQTRQMTRLVDDLLDVSRITQGRIRLRTEQVDLAVIVADAVETTRPVIEEHKHELTITGPGRPVRIEGDPARLSQILTNLLHNAAKFQKDGGRIEVSFGREGGQAVISVQDGGAGIPREMLPNVFDMFAQGDRSPERSQGGLGIGLSLVKKLVEMHGGSVEAASEGPGRGSRFTLRLPCMPEGTVAARSADDAGEAARTGPPLKILVVDDNRDAADSLAMLLKLCGHQVSVAHGGRQAIEIAAAERPQVILLDIGMPGMDGYEACQRIRELGLGDMRIIALTGYGQEADRRLAKEAGFNAHTVKPVALPDLMALLSE